MSEDFDDSPNAEDLDAVDDDDASLSLSLEPGEPVADAEVIEEIARGGGCVVFRARREDGSEVCVVAASPELTGAARDAFMNAASDLAEQIGQPWASDLALPTAIDPIVSAYVVDLAPSGTMADLAVLHWSADQKVELLRRVCEGVGQLHEQGRVHGTLCPEVVLLDAALEPAVVNAGAVDAVDVFQRGAEAIEYTLRAYTAPEVRSGEEAADRYADVYALGRLLHHALIEARPEVPDEAVPRLEDLDAPPGLVRIIRKCTQTDATARYDGAAALADELARYQRDEPVGMRHPEVKDGAHGSIAPPKPAKEKSAPSAGAAMPLSVGMGDGKRSLAIPIAAVLVGGAMLGVAIALGRGAEPPFTWVWLGVAVIAPVVLSAAIPPVTSHPALVRAGAAVLLIAAVVGLDLTRAFDPVEPELGRLRGADVAARVAEFDALRANGETFFMSVDLAGADLSGRQFGAIKLQGSNLSGANLTGASFAGTETMNLDLTGADLTGADVSGLAPNVIKGFTETTCDGTTRLPSGWSCNKDHPTPPPP